MLLLYLNDRRIQISKNTDFSKKEKNWKKMWFGVNTGFLWFYFYTVYDDLLAVYGWSAYYYKVITFLILMFIIFSYKIVSKRPILNKKI